MGRKKLWITLITACGLLLAGCNPGDKPAPTSVNVISTTYHTEETGTLPITAVDTTPAGTPLKWTIAVIGRGDTPFDVPVTIARYGPEVSAASQINVEFKGDEGEDTGTAGDGKGVVHLKAPATANGFCFGKLTVEITPKAFGHAIVTQAVLDAIFETKDTYGNKTQLTVARSINLIYP